MKTIIQSILLLLVFTVLTGILYPLLITGAVQLVFHKQANGSLITVNGKITGSMLIGQLFTNASYFHGRPSAGAYDAMASGGYNLGPASSNLIQMVSNQINTVRKENSLSADIKIPADMVTASASGLDPDINTENAVLQAERIARTRKLPVKTVLDLINSTKVIQTGGFWGVEHVNVLRLNLKLDQIPEGK